jgi:hypothetical protein
LSSGLFYPLLESELTESNGLEPAVSAVTAQQRDVTIDIQTVSVVIELRAIPKQI